MKFTPRPAAMDERSHLRAALHAYSRRSIKELAAKHKVTEEFRVTAMRHFLVTAGRVYLHQKSAQEAHQDASELRRELTTIGRLSEQLALKLWELKHRKADFFKFRIAQGMPQGGLGPSDAKILDAISNRFNAGELERELFEDLNAILDEGRIHVPSQLSDLANHAAQAIASLAGALGGRPPNDALNRWADNVRNFWTICLGRKFTHSTVGQHPISDVTGFCIDAMNLLDPCVRQSEISTAVRYARTAAIRWESISQRSDTPAI